MENAPGRSLIPRGTELRRQADVESPGHGAQPEDRRGDRKHDRMDLLNGAPAEGRPRRTRETGHACVEKNQPALPVLLRIGGIPLFGF